MEYSVILQGELVIARDVGDGYIVTLGGLPFDEQIAHYLKGGEYVYIKLIGKGPEIVIQGGLEIFTLKVERSYFRNGWCNERESEKKYIVKCNSRLLINRIADFFYIKKNTHYHCGWYRILIESK